MKKLHLTLKKKWFYLILSGEKKEEYRDIKPYWITRLCDLFEYSNGNRPYSFIPKDIHLIEFKNGYGKNSPSFVIECTEITISKPNPQWCDNNEQNVFTLKLGNIISNQ